MNVILFRQRDNKRVTLVDPTAGAIRVMTAAGYAVQGENVAPAQTQEPELPASDQEEPELEGGEPEQDGERISLAPEPAEIAEFVPVNASAEAEAERPARKRRGIHIE